MKTLRFLAALSGILGILIVNACGSNEGVVSSSDQSSQAGSPSGNSNNDNSNPGDETGDHRYDEPIGNGSGG